MATLSEVVGAYLLENGEPEVKRMKFMQLAISGLHELSLDYTGVPKMATLPLTAVDTVNLPSDYINYMKIAIVGRGGELHSLGVNNDMSLHQRRDIRGRINEQYLRNHQQNENTQFEAKILQAQEPIEVDSNFWAANFQSDYFPEHYRNGEVTGGFYNIGGGRNSNGYYRVDAANGVIHIKCPAMPYIVLEYLADLERINKDGRMQLQVHPFFVECLKEWIYWKSIEKQRTFGDGAKAEAERRYYVALHTASGRVNSPTVTELQQFFRTWTMQTAKL